jgi:ligand-binding SRPBCC domain-containing protein
VPRIEVSTYIKAPIAECFDLARDIDIHVQSTAASSERAVGGRTSGRIEAGEEVTFEATHFGVRQRLTSKITAFNRPTHFRDSQVRGVFRRFDHDHLFEETVGGTLMRDVFDFEPPLGWLGSLASVLFLNRYLHNFLSVRGREIKRVAEAQRD